MRTKKAARTISGRAAFNHLETLTLSGRERSDP